jgi:glycosyltransferase involved in cell wall biosynthesis
MKVLIVTPSYFPIIGGSEILTRLLATKLTELGVQTDIMTYNMNKKWHTACKAKTETEGKIRVFKVPALNPFAGHENPLFNLARVNALPRPDFIKKFKDYDVIHFLGEADLALPIFSRFLKKTKIFHCVALYPRGGFFKYYTADRPYLLSIFKRFFSNLADAYITYNETDKLLLKKLGVTEKRIFLFPISIDSDLFRPSENEKIDNMLLFVGRIYKIKGLHILLKSLQYIDTPIQLNIIGPRWNEQYVQQLEQMAQSINEKGLHTVRLIDAVDHKKLVKWYQKASILVTPYLYETYNTVTLECLACETPVVSTGGHLTSKTSDGILLTSKDPKALANGIMKLLKDKELRKQYGRDGRKAVKEQFSVESCVKKLVEIYGEMLDEKRN